MLHMRAAVLLLCLAALGFAQDRGSVRGTVSDPTGASVPDAVVTAVISGGRQPAEQSRLVPWGDPSPVVDPDPPWPGRVPPPSPATVHACLVRAEVVDAGGRPVVVGERGGASAEPARVSIDGSRWAEVVGWAGPWPVDERWWAPEEASRRVRFQVCLADGRALLLTLESGLWSVTGVYD